MHSEDHGAADNPLSDPPAAAKAAGLRYVHDDLSLIHI